MPKGQHPHELSERLKTALANEHAGITDYVADLEPYVKANPDDAWAEGQLRYFLKRLKQLEAKLGEAQNRRAR